MGGGPAGASAAFWLAEAGHDVVVVEKKRFRGKITFVDPEIQPIGETAVRIRAEFENPGWELRPGLEGQMTIFLPADAAAAIPQDDAGTRTARVR